RKVFSRTYPKVLPDEFKNETVRAFLKNDLLFGKITGTTTKPAGSRTGREYPRAESRAPAEASTTRSAAGDRARALRRSRARRAHPGDRPIQQRRVLRATRDHRAALARDTRTDTRDVSRHPPDRRGIPSLAPSELSRCDR